MLLKYRYSIHTQYICMQDYACHIFEFKVPLESHTFGSRTLIKASHCFSQASHLFVFYSVCGKPQEKVSPILVTLTSRDDSDFERSNVNLKENKPDGVNPTSNDIDYYVRKNEGKILWFSADCIWRYLKVVSCLQLNN